MTHDEKVEDAYARHFKLVLSSILYERPDFRTLFSTDELERASRFITDLKPFEQQLYARLLQRQGPWYKTTSLFRYFIPAEDITIKRDPLQLQDQKLLDQNQLLLKKQTIQDVLDVLVDAALLQKFPVTTPASSKMATFADNQHSSTWKREHELTKLDTILDAITCCASASELATLYMKMTGSKKNVAKSDLLAAIRKVAKTQRRMDGSRIPVAQLMQDIWLESYPLAGTKRSDVMVLRMTPATRDLVLRVHRLFYFVSTRPFNATSTMPSPLEDVGQVLTLAMHKVRQEPTHWPGLMVVFKKTAYPEYKLTGDSSIQMLHSHRVFPSSEAYVSYEVAYQLHRIMSVVGQCLQVLIPDKDYLQPDLELKWMRSDAPPVFLAFQRLGSMLYEDDEVPETEGKCVGVEANSVQVGKVEDKATANWQTRSWEQFYAKVGKMDSLDDLVLASRSCLQAFLKWTKAAAYSTSSVSIYLSKCNAGYHLVRVLHTAVGLYEKMRNYQIAALLLNELLAAPYLERKRGFGGIVSP